MEAVRLSLFNLRRLAAGSFIGLLCLVVGLRAINARALTPLAQLFTYPNGAPCPRPCLLGIQPNQTSYQTALRYISQHPLTRGFAREISESGAFLSGTGVEITLGATNGKLIHIFILIQPPHPDSAGVFADLSLGELLNALGPPQGALASSVRGQVMLVYPADWLTATTFAAPGDEERLRPTDRIALLAFTAFGEPLRMEHGRWLGFSALDRYFSEADRR